MQGGDGRRAQPTRRQLIAAAGASAVALTAGAGLTWPPALAQGRVFHDRSGTGRRRTGDPGIAGVMVSNGRDVVVTDADGRWQLPVGEGDAVHVIKPPHWAVPTDRAGLPRFSHVQAGGVPATIDFPLRREPESARFEALLLADTQPDSIAELAYLREDIMARTSGSGAAFAINHGDIVFDDHALYPGYLETLASTGLTWHHCPGNHDIDADAPSDRSSRRTWTRIFGARHYAFQHAGATFIVLDNVHYLGHNPGAPTSGRYCGLIGAGQLAFVRNVLARVPPEQLVVLSMHIPLVNYQDRASLSDTTADRGDLLALLSSRRHAVSFSGHMHLTEHHYLGAEDGFHAAAPHHHHVLTAASGAWWGGPKDGRGIPSADSQDGTPNGFHVLSVEGNRYATRFVAAAGKPAGQLRALIDGARSRGPGELVVNVFDGGPATRVTCETAGRRTQLARTAAADPYIVDLFAQSAAAQKPWVQPVASSHLWKAPLPAGLAPGAHLLTVRASDEYGRQLAQHLTIEVDASGTAQIRA